MQSTIHVYEVRPRKDKRGVNLISDAFPFGGLWRAEPNAVRQCGSARRSRSGNWERQPPLPTAVAAFCLTDDARNLTVLREAQHVRRFF
jgi:hypothetical protein